MIEEYGGFPRYLPLEEPPAPKPLPPLTTQSLEILRGEAAVSSSSHGIPSGVQSRNQNLLNQNSQPISAPAPIKSLARRDILPRFFLCLVFRASCQNSACACATTRLVIDFFH